MGAEDFDFALHVCESIAFTLHGALRLSEPCTGIFGKFIAKDSVPYPNIFFPIVGLISLVVSVVNIVCSGSDTIILAVQAYVVAWHSAAAFTHIRIGDPIFVTGVPGAR
ncbi:unnamed protein product [Amoebophrya sp. A120]|nr:unnamed protein product [Amoebophrya sp. A120]|eukprot:GSA120T00002428001.1